MTTLDDAAFELEEHEHDLARREERVSIAIVRDGERVRQARKREVQPLIVGKRRAAKLLGIDRVKNLEPLIASGRISTVNVCGETRIAMTEIERLVRQGIPKMPGRAGRRSPTERVSPQKRRKAKAASPGLLRIRDIPIT